MIRSLLDTKHFATKYDISPTQEHCRCCGVLVEVNIPLISKDFVGYEYIISVLKPRNPNLLQEFEEE